MRDFHTIIGELKLYMANTTKKKILDKDMADTLLISQANFATIKRRNRVPYRHILEFCKREDLCANEIFFD